MTHIAIRRVLAPALVVGVAALCGGGQAFGRTSSDPIDPYRVDEPRTIVGAFGERSYAPGDRAVLRVFRRSSPFSVQVFRAGLERTAAKRADLLAGTPVTPRSRVVPDRRGLQRISIPIGRWPGGMYFARLTSSEGELGFAPFVLRARRPGSSRVLVVLPTNTWQAYNFRDSDGDRVGDTWYASSDVHVVDLSRPYLKRGVPPHFRTHERGFLRWVAQTGKRADFVADEDLEDVPSGDVLARLYDLVVFPGHEEYVTRHAYDVVERFRDLGGNLAFLSANTFVYAVDIRGDRMTGRTAWSSQGRPPAALTGSDYVGWWQRTYPSRPFRVVGAHRAPWLFASTGLRNGSTFGRFGIEVDATSRHSPRGTRVLARITDILGPGRSAEMTYYTTRRGAKVFAAGALDFGGHAGQQPTRSLLENLWRHLSRP